jgi:hypothetical protein
LDVKNCAQLPVNKKSTPDLEKKKKKDSGQNSLPNADLDWMGCWLKEWVDGFELNVNRGIA